MTKLSAAESVEPRENTWPFAAKGRREHNMESTWGTCCSWEFTVKYRDLDPHMTKQNAALCCIQYVCMPELLFCFAELPKDITGSSRFWTIQFLGSRVRPNHHLQQLMVDSTHTYAVGACEADPRDGHQNRRKKNTQGLSSWFVFALSLDVCIFSF